MFVDFLKHSAADDDCSQDRLVEPDVAAHPRRVLTQRESCGSVALGLFGRYTTAMVDPARKRATYADVLAAPPHRVAEVVDGELRLHPRPAKPHAMAATALGEELGPPFKRGRGGPGGWILVFEPELHLGEDILVPDLGGWRRERMPSVVADLPYFELAPDWVCEVVSPRSEKYDRTDKLAIYEREHVGWAWLVNPITHTLEVLERSESSWLLRHVWRDDARVRAEPFDAIELDLSILWADVILPE